jgi:hypothetical protein
MVLGRFMPFYAILCHFMLLYDHKTPNCFKYRRGLIAYPGPFLKIRLFWLDYFLSGCSEKSFSACRKKNVSEREVRTHNVGTNYSVQE